MFRQQFRLVKWGLYAGDMLATAASFYLAYFIRATLAGGDGSVLPFERYSFVLLIVLPAWSVLLSYFGLYKSQRFRTAINGLWIIIKVAVLGGLILNTALFALKVEFISRLMVVVFGVSNVFLLSLWRATVRLAAHYVRKHDYNYRNILLACTGDKGKDLIEIIENQKAWGLNIVGVACDDRTSETLFGYPVLGSISEIPQIIHRQPVDEVMFCLPKSMLDELEDMFLLLEDEGINARVMLNFFPHLVAKVQLEELHGIAFLTFTTVPTDEFMLTVKRALDLSISCLLLVLLSPLLLVTAVMIKLTSPGPVLFRQERIGLHGRKFILYKFRSMYKDAEERKRALLDSNEMDGPVFKMKNDPRITPLGRFLRRSSIDELLQLWNVLNGDMSIVGPRPPLPGEVKQYERWQRRRLSMKPGLTCLWQISGRNKIGFKDWIKLDLQYIDNWSLLLDCKIFLKTIPVVLLGRGAG